MELEGRADCPDIGTVWAELERASCSMLEWNHSNGVQNLEQMEDIFPANIPPWTMACPQASPDSSYVQGRGHYHNAALEASDSHYISGIIRGPWPLAAFPAV